MKPENVVITAPAKPVHPCFMVTIATIAIMAIVTIIEVQNFIFSMSRLPFRVYPPPLLFKGPCGTCIVIISDLDVICQLLTSVLFIMEERDANLIRYFDLKFTIKFVL